MVVTNVTKYQKKKKSGKTYSKHGSSTKVWVMDPILFDVNMTHYCFFMVDKK
jgi:hypothetical protein